MLKLYAMPKSGNCYKVAWMLHILNIPYELIVTTFVDGGTKHPNYLEKNPNGQVPLLEFEDGRRLAESNAILLYLAELQQRQQSKNNKSLSPLLLPPLTSEGAASSTDDSLYQRGLVYQWLFFEQYTHEPAIAVRRANIVFNRPCPQEQMDKLLNKGYHALSVMEEQLSKNSLFIAGTPYMTIADIALYAYTHVAQEGEYDMKRFPNIVNWMERITKTPGFVDMSVLEEK